MKLTTISIFIFSLLVFGCTGESEKHSHEKDHKHEGAHDHDHDHQHEKETGHSHEAPNGGEILVLGDEFAHIELLNDIKNNKFKLFVYDKDLKFGVKVSMEKIVIKWKNEEGEKSQELMAVVDELVGNTSTDSSIFEGAFLIQEKNVVGRIEKIVVKGKEFLNVPFAFK